MNKLFVSIASLAGLAFSCSGFAAQAAVLIDKNAHDAHHSSAANAKSHTGKHQTALLKAHAHDHSGDKQAAMAHAKQFGGDQHIAHGHDHSGDHGDAEAHEHDHVEH